MTFSDSLKMSLAYIKGVTDYFQMFFYFLSVHYWVAENAKMSECKKLQEQLDLQGILNGFCEQDGSFRSTSFLVISHEF